VTNQLNSELSLAPKVPEIGEFCTGNILDGAGQEQAAADPRRSSRKKRSLAFRNLT